MNSYSNAQNNKAEVLSGVIAVDKPEGMTSFDVVLAVRRMCKIKKIGHAGTLDPLATGVLPILIGKATKVQDLIPNTDKEYIAEFVLGVETDTQDITGTVLNRCKANISKDRLKNVLDKFKGDIMQVPPMYSALKIDGKRLYNLARKGIEIERKPRKIAIKKLELLDYDESAQTAKILVLCSKGTYIRTLCSDIGSVLDCGGTLTSLRRTKACGIGFDKSVTLEEIETLCKDNKLYTKLIHIEGFFMCLRPVKISAAQSDRFKNGGGLMLSRLEISDSLTNNFARDEEFIRVYGSEDEFLGLGKLDISNQELKVLKQF